MEQGHSGDQPTNNTFTPSAAAVGSGKKGLSKRTKVVGGVAGFLFLFVIGFVGYSIYQNVSSNAGGVDTLGDPSIEAGANKGLKQAQSISTFSLTSEQIYFVAGNQEGYSSTYPFPVDKGTYRIVRTKTPTVAQSWEQIKPDTVLEYSDDDASTRGRGWFVQGTACFGENNMGYCDADGTSANRLPVDAKPGDVYYYRTELKGQDGTWKPINDEVATFNVPKASLSFNNPEYGEISRWNNRPDSSNVAENPLVTITWSGDGDGTSELTAVSCGSCMLMSSDHPDMRDRSSHAITSTGENTPPLNVSPVSLSYWHPPATTRYYALYNYVGLGFGDNGDSYKRITDVVAHSTPQLARAPRLTLLTNTESVDEQSQTVSSRISFSLEGNADDNNGSSYGYGPFSKHSSQYIVQRSTTPDAAYDSTNPRSMQTTQWSTQFSDFFSNVRDNTTYYYRMKPAAGNWTYSNQEWSQVLKVEPPVSNATYYPAPTLSLGTPTHDKVPFTVTVASADKRGIQLQQSDDNKLFFSRPEKITSTLSSEYSKLTPNRDSYFRLAYYDSNFNKNLVYTPSIKVKTLTDPYDPDTLECSMSAPASVVRGKTMTMKAFIKNNGTSTFAGSKRPGSPHAPQIWFSFDDGWNFRMNKKVNVTSIRPGATLTMTHTFKVPKAAKKNKRQAMVWGANIASPCGDLRKMVTIK